MSNIIEAISELSDLSELPKPHAADARVYENSCDGSLFALVNKGRQDEYMFDAQKADVWDVRRKFLSKRHTVSYKKLDVTVLVNANNSKKFQLDRKCDLVNGLDLVLLDRNGVGVQGILKSIKVEIGCQCIDVWHACDTFGTFVDATCAIHGRKVSRHGELLFVPLALAPFHHHNLLSLIGLEYHGVNILVEFTPAYEDALSSTIYGNAYYIDDRKAALDYQMGTAQVQYSRKSTRTVDGGGTSMHTVDFVHPITMMYFWGFDKASVVNVKLTFNDVPFYDGPLEPLERMQEMRGLKDVIPSMIFFSRTALSSTCQSTINFSRIDRAVLHLTTLKGSSECLVEVRGIGVQPIRIMAGMAGLAFSK
jgi:hypothetical protein